MTSTPQLVGIAALVLLLAVIGVVPMALRPLERIRLMIKSDAALGPEVRTLSKATVVHVEAPPSAPATIASSTTAEPVVESPRENVPPLPETIDAEPSADAPSVTAELLSIQLARENAAELMRLAEDERMKAQEMLSAAERATADAQLQARELLRDAELEAKGIVVVAGQERARVMAELEQEQMSAQETRTRLDALSTVQDAERKAEELLEEAERQRESIVREAEAKAEQAAAVIAQDAERRAQERVEAAELEAKEIVVTTGKERAKLLNALAEERARLEETRTKLDALTAIEEAAQQAEELLAAAEKRRDELLEESRAEAERKQAEAAEGAADAKRDARELLERAELEARKIVEAAAAKGAEIARDLEQERALFEERRKLLTGFLAQTLEEVERTPAASGDPEPALAAKTSAADD